jgi:fructose-1,6-bisphosphatase
MTRLKPGDRGTVKNIESETDDTLIWVKWDNGEELALLDPIDKFKVVKK